MDPRKEAICQTNLYAATPTEYGEAYQAHFMEQYKLCIRSLDYTSKLKHTVNNYFLTINTLLVTAVGLSITNSTFSHPATWHLIIPFVGVLISIVWWSTTNNYKSVNEAKFEILHCIEGRLPLALYKTEWELLKGNRWSPHHSMRLEPLVPWLFAGLYVLIFLFIK